MAARRRRFGQVRKLPSGKFHASFVGPNGIRQNAPSTFVTKTDANRWLAKVEGDLSRGTWLNEDSETNHSVRTPGPGSAITPRSGLATARPARAI
jgi:hypothetical protein